VNGYPHEAQRTDPSDNFSIDAHAAEGQMVSLDVEKQGFGATTQFHPAGQYSATIVIKRVK
jgi:hypothetical protein